MRVRGVRFSFLWGVALVVTSGIVGGVYGKVVVDKVRMRYVSESWHRPTAAAELIKNKRLDRYVTPAPPVFKMSRK